VVVGPQFRSLHQLWGGTVYNADETIDSTAGTGSYLGGYPVGTLKASEYASIKEDGTLPERLYGMVET